MLRSLGLAAATLFVAGHAFATPVLPEGTAIVGEPTTLIGFDAGLNDYLPGGSSAVSDGNIEFFTDDFALGIDFQSDGLLRLWDNLGTGADDFNYTLRFSLVGLSFAAVTFNDVSSLTAGQLLANIINGDTLELVLRDVRFAPGFSHADLNVAVDEPSMVGLFALGLFGAYLARRRRSFGTRNTEITP
jgi:hypothetical protein